MTLLEFVGLHSPVECVSSERGNSIPWVLAFGFLDSNKVVVNEFAQPVAGVAAREVSVVRDITRSKRQVGVQNAEDREVCRHHPVHLAVHNFSVNRLPHYMTGLYGLSHSTAIHRLRYRELDISSWGLDMQVSHDVGVNLWLLGAKNRVDACCQQTPTLWQQNRMYEHELHRVKRPGLNAAQTPSKAPAPLPLPQVHGASAGETTANHTRTASAWSVSAGGGQRV